MRFDVLTIFPRMIDFYISESIIKRAIERSIIEVRVTNIRDFASDKHSTVDDYPFGGGPGMVMKIEPLYNALAHVKSDGIKRHTILLSPEGTVFNQDKAMELSQRHEGIVLISGRYEGVDERINLSVDEELSIGDFVLTGGELPALVIIDAVARLLPDVLGDARSNVEESFTSGLLDYPHFTRPAEFMGIKVPDVLMSGNHKEIWKWRRRESLKRTLLKKPFLIDGAKLTEDEYKIMEQLKEEV